MRQLITASRSPSSRAFRRFERLAFASSQAAENLGLEK